MKRTLSVLVFALMSLMMAKAASATTWYVRADGGGRYTPTRQSYGFTDQQIGCDGQADVSYAAAVAAAKGATTNLHCAYNDFRFLYDSQTDYNKLQWVIAGGDSIIVDNTKQWRIGWDTATGQGEGWCPGWSGGPFGCFNPTIPAGTAAHPTQILGRNYASCSAGNELNKSAMTQIFGGHAVGTDLNLQGAQYVNVECIELARHSNCVRHGYPALPSSCSSSLPLDDYDGEGIITDVNTHDILLQDLWIHGHTDRGIIGAIGGVINAKRVDIDTNGMAGWDLDPGDGTQSPNGVLNLSYVTIEWSGCNQQYPAVDAIPVASCYSQSSAGYGDGMGTPITPFVSVSIDHSIFRYNTQDGEDFGHIISANSLSITNSASYANNGGQFKFAGFSNVTLENNLAVANCLRMSQPIPGVPSSYNQYLSDFCRAGDAISFDFNNNSTGLFANNTFISYAPTTFDVQCWDGTSCANTTLTMNNNIVFAYNNPTTWNMGSQNGGPGGFCGAGCNGSSLPLGTFNRSNNIFYGLRGSCIANTTGQLAAMHATSTGEACLDPQFNNETSSFVSEAGLDGFDFSLSSSSPAKAAGITLSNVSTDYLGNTRKNPTSVGALEYGSLVSLNTLTNWLSPTGVQVPTSPVTTSPTAPTTPKAPYPTAVTLSAAKGPSAANPIIVTAAVTPTATNKGTPTGAVVIFTTSNVPVASGLLNANGNVSWTVPASLSSSTFYAIYAGSTTYSGATSAKLSGATVLASR